MNTTTPILVHVRTYEQGNVVRDILHRYEAEDMKWKTDTLFTAADGREVIMGFWWKGNVPEESVKACRAELAAVAGVMVVEEETV